MESLIYTTDLSDMREHCVLYVHVIKEWMLLDLQNPVVGISGSRDCGKGSRRFLIAYAG